MERAETCSCSLCNKLYTYLYHHIVVLHKYMHSNLLVNYFPLYNAITLSMQPEIQASYIFTF